MMKSNYFKALDLAITKFGLESRQALEASKLLDKQIIREQIAYNFLKDNGYIKNLNEDKNEKIIKLRWKEL